MEAIKLKTKKDTYTDPADANAEPCLAKDSLNLKLVLYASQFAELRLTWVQNRRFVWVVL